MADLHLLDDAAAVFAGDHVAALDRLAGPTLLRVPGVAPRPRARFVAALLHGNEESGYLAVAELLASGRRFPFDLWVFIGNVAAARADGRFGHRFLDGQEDYNRVWERTPEGSPERRLTRQVLDVLDAVDLEAALDLHNTTGTNPPHVILPAGDPGTAALGGALGDLALRWRLPAYTSMEAVSRRCPAVVVECGMAGLPASTAVARTVLERFLALPAVPAAGAPAQVYDMRERVVVRGEARFAFGGALTGDLDAVLDPDLDRANFTMLFAGHVLARVHPGGAVPLRAAAMDGVDRTEETFTVEADGRVRLRRDVMPVMMTRDVVQTRRDCLCYLVRLGCG